MNMISMNYQRNNHFETSKKYLFIGGVGRSGTSSFTEIIGSHSRIVMGMERYNKLFRKQDFSITPYHFEKERFLNIQSGDTFYMDFHRFRVHKDIPQKWNGAEYVGVKYPKITTVFDMTEEALGECKVIYIYRNIFDVTESWNRRLVEQPRWPRHRDYKKAVSFWNNSLHVTRELFKKTKNIICIRFEDIFFIESSIKPVFEWLCLDLDQRVVDILNSKRKIAPKRKAKKALLPNEQKRYIKENANFELYEEFNKCLNILS